MFSDLPARVQTALALLVADRRGPGGRGSVWETRLDVLDLMEGHEEWTYFRAREMLDTVEMFALRAYFSGAV
ncbi:MAG: hypothetical protein ACOVT5_01925 [Armatimonadaceae bacterium]